MGSCRSAVQQTEGLRTYEQSFTKAPRRKYLDPTQRAKSRLTGVQRTEGLTTQERTFVAATALF